MDVYMKRKAVDLNSGILECQNMCRCNRKSFVGVDIIIRGEPEPHRYTWAELDMEIAKLLS